MMIRWICLIMLGLYPAIAAAQFTPGHTVRVMNPQGTVLDDAGGAAGSDLPGQGYLTELGITNTGTPLCINDALTNATGGYHAFCFGANSAGAGRISFNAFGGASPLPLILDLNGIDYPFPFSAGGITGPTTTVVNDLACWNNTTGTLLKDCNTLSTLAGQLSVSGNVPNWSSFTTTYDLVKGNINGCTAADEFGGGTVGIAQAVIGCVIVPPNIGPGVENGNGGNGVAGVAVNTSAKLGAAVGVQGAGWTAATAGDAWGGNFVVKNCIQCGAGGGFGGTAGKQLANYGIEVDVNINDVAGAQPPFTTAFGIDIVGGSLSRPAPGSGVWYGIAIQSPSIANITTGCITGLNNHPNCWDAAIASFDGSSYLGLQLGAASTIGPSIQSQAISLHSYTAASAGADSFVFTDGNQAMHLIAPGALSLDIGPGIGSATAVIQARSAAPISGATGMFLLVNNNAGVNLIQVQLSNTNACGTGLRCLAVAN